MSGGGGGGQQNTSSTSKVTTTTVPEYLRPYLTDVSSRAQAESRTPYQAYGGQRNEGFNADQQAAMGDIRGMESPEQFAQASNMYGAQGNLGYGAATQGLGGAGIAQGMGMGQAAMGAMGGFGTAGQLAEQGSAATTQGMQRAFADSTPQAFGADQAQQYTNPFQQNVTDMALRQAREESIRQGNLANLSAAGRGTAGGTRQAVMDSMRNRDTATGLSDIQMQGSMRGYENAQQQFERDQGRRMGAAQLGANIAGQGFGAMGQAGGQYGSLTGQGYSAAGQANSLLGQTGMQGLGTGAAGLSAVGTAEQNANLARLNAQNKVGSQMQDQETAKINARIEQFYEKRGYNKEQIAWMINQMKQANSGASSNATGSTYGRSPSFGTQMTGVTAAGLGSLI